MNGMADFDISQILSSFYRRKGLIICVCVVVFFIGYIHGDHSPQHLSV